MQRRRFLGVFAIGAAGLTLPRGAGAAARASRSLRCRVAGRGFHDVDVRKLKPGARAIVERDRYGNETCYRILDHDGTIVGFVPRELLPQFEGREIESAWFIKVNPHAVPWKQLEVAILWK